MNLDRYWRTDRWHSHTVVFDLNGETEAIPVDCPPGGGILCHSTHEDRVGVSFVSAVGAASVAHLTRVERLHRWCAFHVPAWYQKRLAR